MVQIEYFKKSLQDAMVYADRSYDYFKDENIDTFIAISYLQVAVSKFSMCELYYHSNLEILEDVAITKLFDLFNQYVFSSLHNAKTNKKHWDSAEYRRLRNSFDSSKCAFDN